MYQVRGFERIPAMGGDPSEHDRGCVLDASHVVKHPITGEPQHPAVYFGTLAECWRWIRENDDAQAQGCSGGSVAP
jgi:hypothetical protein